ncbi:MAG: DUF885 domain-containing protein [Flavobacteriales bacterium]|nr:DUF885 domain-containing protein [Flavobacteriales bacterium]
MRNFVFLIASVLLISCGDKKEEKPLDFKSFEDRFIHEFWKHNPGWASYVGYHDYDSLLVAPTEENRLAEVAFCNAYLDSLKIFDESKMSKTELTDLMMIRDQLQATIWYAEVFKEYEWNPSNYNVGGAFGIIINGNYAPLDARLRAISSKMEKLDAYYAAAKANIKNPTVQHTDLAIMQNAGALEVFGTSLIDSVHASGLNDAEKENLFANIEFAKMAIQDYIDFLEKEIKPTHDKHARDFRIGKELFDQKFKHEIVSSYSAEEIYGKAVVAKAELHGKMFGITQELWLTYFPKEKMPADSLIAIRKMIDVLSLQHCHRDSFQSTIAEQIPELTAFVKNKDLLYLDPEKPLVVRKEPAYMAGVAGASISAPGPYDKYGDTYYNVGSLANYTDAEAESYLREYNTYILQILNIHEAIPGHYAQLVYANQAPSLVKSIFGNGTMIEGWAVYTERMMLEEGYGNNSKEMWLMYYKWNLRTVCNTILDYSIHVNGMTEQQALDLMVNQAFQQEAEAKGKWRRATLTQVQLCSYFTGFYEIMQLRDELKAKKGKGFKLKAFHEEFLSFGSAPVKYVRELMLDKGEQPLAKSE